MEQVRINNKRPAFLHLPDLIDIPQGAPLPIIRREGKSLIPGGNNIDRDYWAEVKENRTVKSWLALGWITEGGKITDPEGPEAPKSLSGYNAPAAIALVDTETDAVALKRWSKIETRPEVKSALKRRLADVK